MAVNVFATGNQLSENVSRQDLVEWANNTLHVSYTKVENFCSGACHSMCVALISQARRIASSWTCSGQVHPRVASLIFLRNCAAQEN